MKQQILVPAFESPRPCFLQNMSDFDKLKLYLKVNSHKAETDRSFEDCLISRIRLEFKFFHYSQLELFLHIL